MPKVLILRGIQGSGKSTYAKKLVDKGGWIRVNKDDLRAMLFNSKFNGKKEKAILTIRDRIITNGLRYGYNVVVDDTNLNPTHIDRIGEVVENQQYIDNDGAEEDKKVTYDIEIKDFEVTLDEAIKNDLKREKSVGETVIRDTWNKWIRPTLTLDLTPKDELESAAIWDLDGTLALLNGRDPYDASEAEYDLPNYPVIDALHRYQEDGGKVIITSGRSDEYEKQTFAWLEKNNIKPDVIIMRKQGDTRKDYDVKKEMFMDHIYGKFNVEFVFDDRQRVVDGWRDLGLTVFQVADGNF